ncbi:MAG: DUF6443 domain-containing protein [Bacteroidales bacterium]
MLKQYYIIILIVDFYGSAFAQSPDQNYIHTLVPLIEMEQVPINPTKEDVKQIVQYFDGLGRPLQTVQRQFSPTSLDIVQGFEFDEFGRQQRNFFPIPRHLVMGPTKRTGWAHLKILRIKLILW